jgi:transposase
MNTAAPEKQRIVSKQMGALPIINQVMDIIMPPSLLGKFVEGDVRSKMAPSVVLGIMIRNLLVSREPLYSLKEWVQRCDEKLLGVASVADVAMINDDRFGRCLDKLFEAKRAELMTAIVLRAVKTYGISLDELHNDSTTITFEGDYRGASGEAENGKRSRRITYGHNKDHRPDLKQLLYNLTTSADGAIPVWCSVEDGNTSDDSTHIGNWNTLRQLVGGPDFMYVADSKLCTRDNLEHIDSRGGHFVTVLPRTRREVAWFREWIEKHQVSWSELLRQRNSRHKSGPDEVYQGFVSPIPSSEGFRILWVHSSQKREADMLSRDRRVARASEQLSALAARLASPKVRKYTHEVIQKKAQSILAATQTTQLVNVAVQVVEEDAFKQAHRGRPNKNTIYVRIPKMKIVLHWSLDDNAIREDAKMDGIFPLITNDRSLSPLQILQAYKHQPALERQHEQLKTVLEVMPMFLKSPRRIEALLFLYFLALLIQTIIQRQLRLEMTKHKLKELPLYPEERGSKRPTATQTFRLFDDLRCHRLLTSSGTVAQTFMDSLSDRQLLVLKLLGVPAQAYG